MASNSMLGRVPPQNEEAERAVLGAILLNEKVLVEVTDFLGKDDFYKVAHQHLFGAIVAFRQESSETLDLITLSAYLKRKSLVEQCGGLSYISTLTSDVPTTTNAAYYAKILKALSQRRKLLLFASKLKDNAFDESQDIQKVIDEGEQSLSTLSNETAGSDNYYSIKDLITNTISDIEMRSTSGIKNGFETGYLPLDSITGGFKKQEFIIVGARPSIGKTAFALSLTLNMIVKKKYRVGFFSLEMSAASLMERLLTGHSRVDFSHIRKATLKNSEMSAIIDASGALYEAELYIQDTPNMKLMELRAQARRMKLEHDIQVIYIDYIGLIDAEADARIPRHEQISIISRSLKQLARELDLPVVCLCQVGRQADGVEPKLSDLRDSGSIEQDADVVILLHRDVGKNRTDDESEREKNNIQETKIIMAKNRNGETGVFSLAFVSNIVRFEEMEFSRKYVAGNNPNA
ncbi:MULTISPECIES: replicative DNA helicase [Sphaerochaeta]|jgi:replicative DNA helicase|uniref:Replicative DNA helicase n=2 Tax=root TaxID=1 RepID=A0ABY4DEV2_9SPIR|nr:MULTISPECIES: replicative DNA helicase [Sphaerochaeta]MDT3360061.1 replicative DNA helicase [Spirochaetota bacterium]MDD2394666.1 replicative DNA helicase [Sphaerochaeta sp.]MDD3423886.1 replicative DNA helicase [Sphaerochaeta sp.]MDD3456360.1 replicative DNA helicase [Sphaerochaeta sp.]MDD4037618.1 replicative DNA helicase [Sphaerochaeta sp.]